MSGRVHKLTAVYHAKGSLTGELTYLIGKLVGVTSCALCDITHGTIREKASFAACRHSIPVSFDTVHLDEMSEALASFVYGQTPCVVAHTETGFQMLLTEYDLSQMAGSVGKFQTALQIAMSKNDLEFHPG